MKNENTIPEAERIAKAFNQLANAIGNLCKAIRKVEQKDFATGGIIPKTHPFYGMPMVDWLAGMYENGLYKKFHEAYNVSLDHKVTIDFAKSAAYNAVTFMQDEKVIEASIKAFDAAFKKYPYDDDEPHPDYVCIKDFGQMKVGDIIKYQWIENYNEYVYAFIDKQNMIINSTKEGLEKNTEFFKKVETKATTIYHDFICSKDYVFINGVVKKGTTLKKFKGDYEPDRITSFYFFIDDKGTENLFPLSFLETNSEHFKIVYSFPFVTDKEIKINANKTINEQQTKFDLLEENQIIEFKLRNGKRYKAQVLRDLSTETYYLNSNDGSNAIYFHDLNQMDYKNNLNKLYGNNDVYPSAPDLECLTNDLNTLIQLPDLSNKETPLADLPKVVIAETKTCDENIIIQHTKLDEKFYNDQGLEFKCEELIAKFMPLVTKWKFEGNTIVNQEETYSGVWSYSDNNKRKAAIKIAILHCELNMVLPLTTKHFETIKNKLEKMLSE